MGSYANCIVPVVAITYEKQYRELAMKVMSTVGRGNRTVPITFSVGLLLAACTAGSPHQSLFSRPASRRRARRAVTRNCVSRTTPTIATTAAPATAAMNSAVPSGTDPVKPR